MGLSETNGGRAGRAYKVAPDGKFAAVGQQMTDVCAKVWRVWQSTDEMIAYAKECCVFRELTVEERVEFGLSKR